MRKVFRFLITTFIFGFCLFTVAAEKSADTNMLRFSMSQEAGLMNGNIYEYVFDSTCKNTNNLLSMLDWELNIPYSKTDFLITNNEDYFYDLSVLIGIPGNSGCMQDYDWLNTYSWPKDDPTEKTNYSIHNNISDIFLNLSLKMGKEFFTSAHSFFDLYVQYDLTYFHFTGNDGYTSYKSNNWEKRPLSGRVIGYDQTMFMPYFGFSGGVIPFNNFDLVFDFSLNPGMGFVNANDYHYVNRYSGGTIYNDRMERVVSLKSALKTNYFINNKNKLSLKIELSTTASAAGPDYIKNLDKEGNVISKKWTFGGKTVLGGTSSSYSTIGLQYTHTF